jgi:hypothetical protein
MRLKAEVVEARKNLVVKFFNDNMSLMGQVAWDAAAKYIKDSTGMAMAPDTILELFGKVHSDGVKAKAVKVELLAPKTKPGMTNVVQGVVSEDQSKLIAGLRRALKESLDIVQALRDENVGLKCAVAAGRKENRTVKGNFTVIDIPADISKDAMDDMIKALQN